MAATTTPAHSKQDKALGLTRATYNASSNKSPHTHLVSLLMYKNGEDFVDVVVRRKIKDQLVSDPSLVAWTSERNDRTG